MNINQDSLEFFSHLKTCMRSKTGQRNKGEGVNFSTEEEVKVSSGELGNVSALM